MAASSADISSKMSNPLPQSLAEKLFGFCTSQAIFSSLELGIFDVLEDFSSPLATKDIAKHLSTDPDATVRLLDTLVSLELLEKTTTDPAKYCNTEIAKEFLLRRSRNSVHNLLPLLKSSYKMFPNLTHAIREGRNQWHRFSLLAWAYLMVISVYNYVFSASVDIFSLIYATKSGLTSFLRGLSGSSKMDADCFVTAYDLSKFRRVCDLGGATGEIAYSMSTHYPNSTITVMDLSKVTECAPQFKPLHYECPNQGCVEFLAGDFFKDKLPEADLFILARIFQSFDEEKMDELLAKIYNNLQPGGAILIGEKLLNNDRSGPLLGNISSLTMLLVGHKGSTEHSGIEYQHILDRHGFVNIEYKLTGGTFLDAIMAEKPL